MTVLTREQAEAILPVLKAWEEWRLAGAPDGEPFSRNLGLCAAADQYHLYTLDDVYKAAETGLRNLFLFEGLSPTYPFGEDAFYLADVLHLDKNASHSCNAG